MNILFLSPVIPHPQTDGGRQRIHSILAALVGTHAVTFVGIGREADFSSWTLATQLSPDSFTIELGDGDSGDATPGLPWWAHPMSVARLERAGLWSRLKRLPLASYQVAHAETILLAPFADAAAAAGGGAFVLDLPDITSHYRLRVLLRSGAALLHPRALRELDQIARLYALEGRMYRRAGAIYVCSDIDRTRILKRQAGARVAVVPNCTHLGAQLPPPPDGAPVLVFIGTMSYAPNDQGIRYFCGDVWPLIRREVPDARLIIVGKSPSPEVLALGRNVAGVEVTGEVDDVRPYLARATASVVPLLAGGGTRLKILESMAAGRAVVSTTIGAEGIDATSGEHILLADKPEDFATECIRVLTDKALRDRIATAGRARAEEKYDWSSAQALVLRGYESLARSQGGLRNNASPAHGF